MLPIMQLSPVGPILSVTPKTRKVKQSKQMPAWDPSQTELRRWGRGSRGQRHSPGAKSSSGAPLLIQGCGGYRLGLPPHTLLSLLKLSYFCVAPWHTGNILIFWAIYGFTLSSQKLKTSSPQAKFGSEVVSLACKIYKEKNEKNYI